MSAQQKFWIGKEGQRLGPFDEATIRNRLVAGDFHGHHLAWCKGMPRWEPLGVIFGLKSPAQPATIDQIPPDLPVREPHAVSQTKHSVPTPSAPNLSAGTNGSASTRPFGWQTFSDQITDRIGLERIEGFDLSKLFAQTFSHHSELEMEDVLMVGTLRNTSSLAEVETGWPTPWVFARMLLASTIVVALFWFGWDSFQNPNLIPGLIITGSFAMPFSALMFFFEANAVRNVSLHVLIKLAFFGGILALLAALVLYQLTGGLTSVLGASSAGIVEESAKLAAVLWIIRNKNASRYPYILNGILFGAAVGAGFAAFESAGYALRIGLMAGSDAMTHNILIRGILSPLGHIVWTGIAAGALWRVKGDKPFEFGMLFDKRVYPMLILSMMLHFIWDMDFTLPFLLKYLALGLVAWVAIIALMQAGLRQVAEMKQQLLAHN